MRQFNPRQFSPNGRSTEGIILMTIGLTAVILGVTALNLPAWTAAVFIPIGLILYIFGLSSYR